jgi:sugar phosphate permease
MHGIVWGALRLSHNTSIVQLPLVDCKRITCTLMKKSSVSSTVPTSSKPEQQQQQQQPEIIADAKQHDAKLKSFQFFTFAVLYVGFVAYTATKRSLSFTAAAAIQAGDLTQSDVGTLASILSATFAVSKFFGGVACDRYNPIVLMAVGLLICGASNVVFALSSSLLTFSFMWFLNGVFQSPSWPPVALLMTRWYSREERPTWWSVSGSVLKNIKFSLLLKSSHNNVHSWFHRRKRLAVR